MKRQDDALTRVRKARFSISAKVGHDPEKLIAYYMKIQDKYKDRLISPTTPPEETPNRALQRKRGAR